MPLDILCARLHPSARLCSGGRHAAAPPCLIQAQAPARRTHLYTACQTPPFSQLRLGAVEFLCRAADRAWVLVGRWATLEAGVRLPLSRVCPSQPPDPLAPARHNHLAFRPHGPPVHHFPVPRPAPARTPAIHCGEDQLPNVWAPRGF